MPTPFQHLIYAKTILESDSLPAGIRAHLHRYTGAFLLGSTAVDVQSITGQGRAETHFYHVFQDNPARAGDTLFAAHPELASPHRLDPARAAFIIGYLAHLVWDELWLWNVFRPFYMESHLWPDRLTRNVHHNALRVLADRQAEAELRSWPGLSALLRNTHPSGWLPFVTDPALEQWRNWLADQLDDTAEVQTAQVFARRMGVSTDHLEAVALSIAMDTYRPSIPGLHTAVEAFEAQALAESIAALTRYWQQPT